MPKYIWNYDVEAIIHEDYGDGRRKPPKFATLYTDVDLRRWLWLAGSWYIYDVNLQPDYLETHLFNVDKFTDSQLQGIFEGRADNIHQFITRQEAIEIVCELDIECFGTNKLCFDSESVIIRDAEGNQLIHWGSEAIAEDTKVVLMAIFSYAKMSSYAIREKLNLTKLEDGCWMHDPTKKVP